MTDDSIPDDKTHIIEWEDHIGCEHDTTIRNSGVNKVICAKRRYRRQA